MGACVLDAPSVEILHSFEKGGEYIPYVFPMYSLYIPNMFTCSLCIIVEVEVEGEVEVEEL